MPHKRTAHSEPRHVRTSFAAAGSGCVLLLLVLSVTPALVATPGGALSAKRSVHQSATLATSIASDASQCNDVFEPAPVPHDDAPRVCANQRDDALANAWIANAERLGMNDLPPPTA